MTESFERISAVSPLPSHLRGGVVAIGNFDGVHRGHQSVLERALAEARRRGVPALVLTFEPHPRKVFRPDLPLFVLTPPPMKARLLSRLGFAALVEQPFTRDFAALSAEAFVTDVLEKNLGISHAVTGFDFHFGKDRQGGPAFLMAAGERHGFGVTLVDAFRDEGAEVVSSSRIRALLCEGDVAEAASLLGYRFTVESEVIGGQQLGRTLGFPTANMKLSREAALREGVYAVRFRRANGALHDGVASFGRRPTVDDNGAPLLETFVFDFSGDLYGEVCQVSFFGYLRPELKFDGLEALVAQMKRDEAEARALLAGVRPLSELDAAIAF
ncbi:MULTISPECIES: bifunctional riboflavin kinase/FAD synthetase [unclassified Mesorhizobium]|uniref:bifunctional riboflavin kinase/FAD synthetase n=1 Tax=unclassified Mesorhizobium TaxID=325217 RepID=UPI000BAFC093|nr:MULTISPECIES: bifunctional riboflavin kinase/FAD synthetase [unclassified Mesorhizobium]TGT53222.1 bifunctional riboflavin kinase/FAD synthetase [Mesorhizobium sp. M00.F.Ca.ET.170.01.1.1]AZO08499.1 bifunctional riboflavin kinase/FAD synthetase [Mesorhizobium sp. M3A.F.Ca.ET.080.04.2.1]PBB83367.1 riboflavin biosynthesis protein RibF [Mesorhizobium sp. WSM3876]RWB82331.1 MAG: bifunctional riboflavin kinase/FAD synthetase [Mesorhizobium sp.]RWE24967.1 MAG: bifunctional riboflavin kinase/FAD sy